MKYLVIAFFIMYGFFTGAASAQPFKKSVQGEIELVQKGAKKQWCTVSANDLRKTYKTSHTAHSYGGEATQYASLTYLVFDEEENHAKLHSAKVVDVISNKLIPVKEAFYVLGSEVKGTQSKTSKLAFASKEAAEKFIAKRGGEIVSFEQAFEHAYKTLKEDMKPANPKKLQKEYKKGAKIYAAKCKEASIDATKYDQPNELKADVKDQCKSLKGKQLHSVTRYLWDVKRVEHIEVNTLIEVTKEDKCPVCGMFVYKYPKWAAKLEFVKHNHNHYYVFDGVKDMIKFIHNPKKYHEHEEMTEQKLLVTDYYTQYAIDGKEAYYVVGSDTLGPMGNELIPFKYEEDAKIFLKDHRGTSILKYEQITSDLICELDGFETCE